ncbi:Cbs2p [Kluyveromyces lactis]|uniref:KLLA0D18733p n=1 Tax=Kluyveromyces lactis (strain ATCC 8585 / CBS 2359 / DSM 70799 / NBRC 1267 / NRRL Y-1140 / WM37) TaxID=284590 RepID=Q6CQ98_KLULA|nr:uncharacterized protein KLLA0_D18733g [Kluyveromyces lactis]CAH00987.1 KLLA0D18733p [Kluyveromyces lactis]|eukprot:XP_453891.1 uncharacterized protein KLLA0_D18733g [Kluyveromyces lactis]
MSLPRVYTVGTSNIASALAFDIAKIPTQPTIPNVVVLLQDSKLLTKFTDQNSKLTVFRKTPETRQFMASCAPPKLATGAITAIDNLIVAEATNKSFTMTFQKYKKSLDSNSNVLIVNPGYGLLEFINRYIWNKDEERPKLFIANVDNDHGTIINSKGFTLRINKNPIPISITKVPDRIKNYTYEKTLKEEWTETFPLMQLLAKLKEPTKSHHIFQPSFHQYGVFMLIKCERLLIDSCVEPLAVLFESQRYGELLKSPFFQQLVDELLTEQINILNICYPFLRSTPHFDAVFNKDILKKVIHKHIYDRRFMRPRMLENSKALNKTNINQLTGYFISLAKYKKIPVPKNEMVFNLVRGKIQSTKDRALFWSL